MKQVTIYTPIFENVQTGLREEVKWETSDGKVFDSESSAEHHELYNCKIKKRGINLPIDNVRIFDFQCKEDLEKYEEDYIYNGETKQYDKETMVFPNTYVMWEEYYSDDDYDDEYGYYDTETLLHCELLEDYKKRLIEAVNKIN